MSLQANAAYAATVERHRQVRLVCDLLYFHFYPQFPLFFFSFFFLGEDFAVFDPDPAIWAPAPGLITRPPDTTTISFPRTLPPPLLPPHHRRPTTPPYHHHHHTTTTPPPAGQRGDGGPAAPAAGERRGRGRMAAAATGPATAAAESKPEQPIRAAGRAAGANAGPPPRRRAGPAASRRARFASFDIIFGTISHAFLALSPTHAPSGVLSVLPMLTGC